MAVVSYKCPNCGGNLTFDPTTQSLKCGYCLSAFSEEEVKNLTTEHSYDTPGQEIIEDAGDTNSDSSETGTSLLYTCPSCGAEIVTDQTTAASLCCYCHNPVVFSKQLSDEFKPSMVIPFKKSKDDALNTFKSWCSRKKFLPDDFSSPSQLEKIAGLYVPYWLVDCDTHGYLRGTGKKITSWRSGEYQYTKTDVYAISRAADMSFEYLPHDASKKADDKIMDSIGPFEYEDLTKFSYSYLSGFIAEKYDVPKEEIYPTVKARVERAVENELSASIYGYSTTSIAGSNVQVNRTRFHYTLMPTWILTYLYKGQTYMYAMNGQTGKTFGSVPISKSKLNRFCALLFVICFAIILFVLLYIGGINL